MLQHILLYKQPTFVVKIHYMGLKCEILHSANRLHYVSVTYILCFEKKSDLKSFLYSTVFLSKSLLKCQFLWLCL